MKKCFAMLLAVVLALAGLPAVSAEGGELLLAIGGKSLYAGQSIEEISASFGQPRLVTDSAFGGQAYTYYGDHFADYLYLETDAGGDIKIYGTITPGFTTPEIRYGDTYTNYSPWIVTDDDDRVVYLCLGRYQWQEMERYQDRYRADEDRYLAGLQQHGVMMYNAVASQQGKPSSFAFHEQLFFINQQLKENGSNFYDYANATGQSSYVSLIMLGRSNAVCPVPVMYASYARNYTIDPSASYACFDFHEDRMGVYFVDPAILAPKNTVPLTGEEQALLADAQREFAASVELHNAVEKYFTEDYVYDQLPLRAGTVDPRILEASVGYINAIRAGAGLPKLALSEYFSNASQHKAVLTMYLGSQNISNPSPHFPPQPEGVSDEFYQLAQAGNGENLYFASYFGADDIIGSLQKALQEAYGDVIACGHRYNLLDPNWENIGLGVCAGQGVHKLNGYQESDVDLVAWPSKGVMLTDLNYASFRWTARFYSGRYRVTDSTTVEVTNLNSATTWNFTDEDSEEYEMYRLLGNNQVTFYNAGITYSQGDVFQITLHNVLCNGEPTDYTYRTVFARASAGSQTAVSGLSLDRSSLTLTTLAQTKLHCTLTPDDAANKWVDWASSDETVASVSPNGLVTALKPGTAVITATSQDTGRAVQCAVTVSDVVFGDVDRNARVDASDALLALQYSVGLISLDEKQKLAANVSGDDRIDASDALLILQHSVQLIDRFPVEKTAA